MINGAMTIYTLSDCAPEDIKYSSKNKSTINWFKLTVNSNAKHLLERNIEKVEWNHLSLNRNAIQLLDKNPDKINLRFLLSNPDRKSVV